MPKPPTHASTRSSEQQPLSEAAASVGQQQQATGDEGAAASPMHGPNQLPPDTLLPHFQGEGFVSGVCGQKVQFTLGGQKVQFTQGTVHGVAAYLWGQGACCQSTGPDALEPCTVTQFIQHAGWLLH